MVKLALGCGIIPDLPATNLDRCIESALQEGFFLPIERVMSLSAKTADLGACQEITSLFGKGGIANFEPASTRPVFDRGSPQRRLRLVQIFRAAFAKKGGYFLTGP